MTRPYLAPFFALLLGCSSTASPAPADDGGGSSGSDGSTADSAITGTEDAAASDSGAAADSAASADTWASYAAGFFATYCTSCHNPHDPTGRDFNLQAKVETDKLVARCGVAVTQDPTWNCAASPVAKQFPIGSGPKPTDAERDRIVAWITAGAP